MNVPDDLKRRAMQNFMHAVYDGEVEIEECDIETCTKKIASGDSIYKFAVTAEMGRIEQESSRASALREGDKRTAALEAENAALRKQVEALSAPVTDDEAELLVAEAHDGWRWLQHELNAILAARKGAAS